jgi:hypothetical protein
MHFHPGWSGPTEVFGHGGYYTGDGRYESVGHQEDRKASRKKNRTVRNAKLDHPVSPKAIAASGQQHKQWVPKAVSSADGSGGNQDQIGLRSETSADDEAKHSTEKGPEEIAEKQNKAPSEEREIKAKIVVSSQHQPNRTTQFLQDQDRRGRRGLPRRDSTSTSLVSSMTHA